MLNGAIGRTKLPRKAENQEEEEFNTLRSSKHVAKLVIKLHVRVILKPCSFVNDN